MDILLIEDNLTITKALTYTFETNGLTVKSVNNLTDAYDLTLAHYKLILLDVSLPDGSGFDFYKDMLSNKNIPTIFLTAKSLEDDVVKGLNLGAEDYITKPFSTRVLLSYLIFKGFTNQVLFSYKVPFKGIIVSIAIVCLLIVWLNNYSSKKANKGNVIETIRNENI